MNLKKTKIYTLSFYHPPHSQTHAKEFFPKPQFNYFSLESKSTSFAVAISSKERSSISLLDSPFTPASRPLPPSSSSEEEKMQRKSYKEKAAALEEEYTIASQLDSAVRFRLWFGVLFHSVPTPKEWKKAQHTNGPQYFLFFSHP